MLELDDYFIHTQLHIIKRKGIFLAHLICLHWVYIISSNLHVDLLEDFFHKRMNILYSKMVKIKFLFHLMSTTFCSSKEPTESRRAMLLCILIVYMLSLLMRVAIIILTS